MDKLARSIIRVVFERLEATSFGSKWFVKGLLMEIDKLAEHEILLVLPEIKKVLEDAGLDTSGLDAMDEAPEKV